MNRRHVPFLILPVALFALDRWAKWLAVTEWSTDPIHVLPGVRLSLLVNRAGPLTIPLPDSLLLALTVALTAGFMYVFARSLRHSSFRITIGSLLVVAGGISNLIDRIVYNGVIDYVDIQPLPVVNIADLLIVGGILVLILPRRVRQLTT